MNGHPTNEEGEALLAGDRVESLEPLEAADLSLLAGLLADPSTWAEPRAGLEDSVVHAVEDASIPADDPSVLSSAGPTPRAATRRRRGVMLPAASAAAAIAVVVGSFAIAGSGPGADFTSRLSAVAAPGATASATFTKNKAGFRVVLDARGLPTLGAGQYYEAWLKSSADILVPIGTFSSSDGRVTLWSGVSPNEYRAISVTIEAADGNQASSGRKVLAGVVRAT